MIRSRLHYHRPADVTETSAVLAEHHGNVAVLGGGTQLLPRMTRDEVHVEHIVDLQDLSLDHITEHNGLVELEARVTYADVLESDLLRQTVPLLPRVARGITGGRQLTQQATLVGAACHNYPGTDIPGALVALDATMRVQGPEGHRDVPAAEFLLGALRVDLRPGEFVRSFLVSTGRQAGYCKVKHSAGSWPIATASALREPDGRTAVTLGAVEELPVRVICEDTDQLRDLVRDAVTSPWHDVLAPAAYRRAIAGVVAHRAFSDLLETTS